MPVCASSAVICHMIMWRKDCVCVSVCVCVCEHVNGGDDCMLVVIFGHGNV